MQIIIASTDAEISTAIAQQFDAWDIQANLSVVEATDDFHEALKSDNFDFIIADYLFDGIDIWKLAKLVNSKQLAAHALPIYLIEETCNTEIPPVLAKEYSFHVTPIMQLPHTVQAAKQRNHNIGYRRGPMPSDKATLLLIEDDEDAAEVVYQALKDNYEIDRASDGEQGVLLWTQKRHDLVLLDYMLPGLNGDEVLAKIMALNEDQPVVVMTAYDKSDYNKNFILNGASQYLPKPFTLADLRSQCQIVLSKAKLIYQSHYMDTKITRLSALAYELDHQLNKNNIDKAKRVMASIKAVLPSTVTEDDQAKWDGQLD